jgi:transcriptional regulator with XRE-family HTH domain
LKISSKNRAAGRFIGAVRKALISAAIQEKRESGLTQAVVAQKLGVHRSVINRLLRGSANLTLRSVAEIAWALGWEIVFQLRKRNSGVGQNDLSSGSRPETDQTPQPKLSSPPIQNDVATSGSTQPWMEDALLKRPLVPKAA